MNNSFIALLVVASSLAPAHAQYTDQQFQDALEGYLLVAHDDLAKAAYKLYQTGSRLENAELLRDATHNAIRINNVELAKAAATKWYDTGGGAEALELLTRIQIPHKGLAGVVGLMQRLAKEASPQVIYAIIRTNTRSPDPRAAQYMQASYPAELHDDDYYAYLALLQLANSQLEPAQATIAQARQLGANNPKVLLVALFIADTANDATSIGEIIEELEVASGTDLETVVLAYKSWKEHLNDPEQPIPHPQDLAAISHQDQTKLIAADFLLRRVGKASEALNLFRKIPRNSPEHITAVIGQTRALKVLHGKDASAQILELLSHEVAQAAAENKPRLGVAYARELREVAGHEAAFDYLSAVAREADDLDVLFELSIDADRLGRVTEAEAALLRYIELDPQSAVGYNALSYLYAVHNIKLEQALDLVTTALRFEPNSPAIIDTHGWVLYRLGYLEQALARILQAAKLINEPNAEILAHIGEILWELGRVDEAKQIFAQAYQVDAKDFYLLQTLKRYGVIFEI